VSGHSKWSSIKHKKGAADAKRGQLFSKLSRAIIIAAREGGPDPEGNATLAAAIQKARDNSMPKDNIERAVARGSGAGSDADAYETVTYEGYGPNGVAVLVEAVTDNRNRTVADVRHIFGKNDGNLGGSGAVAWLFERKGVILVSGSADEEDVMLAAADAGADDIQLEGSSYEVTTSPDELAPVREALESAGIEVESADLPDRGRGRRPQAPAPHGRARRERRRSGRLRELRHSRRDSRGGRLSLFWGEASSRERLLKGDMSHSALFRYLEQRANRSERSRSDAGSARLSPAQRLP
jgi:YebC/PmpR family DNA-binding regulatory protein